MQTRIFHLHNLSALHVGTGQGVGVVDLPIARAKATNLPIVAGSALKGVLRSTLAEQAGGKDKLSETDINTLFGKREDADHASAVAFGDANLLILPIRSFAGTVAYATCPFILRQYKRDLGLELALPSVNDNQASIGNGSVLTIGNKIALEDLDIVAETAANVGEWASAIAKALYSDGVMEGEAWREAFAKRFVVLPDSIFSFLADTATEVRTRIRITPETRIVQDGALWTEENLPADSVLWGVIGVSDSRSGDDRKAEELVALLPNGEQKIQLGGKHSVGRGLCRLLITAN